ncbi:MAG: hypothetical protein JWM33_3061 [Caulobacteraceae bacterium]|nr:hypothetical protein [Caulobacteraceae bacterium]
MSETWEIVKEQFGATLQRSGSPEAADAPASAWRVIAADGRLLPAFDEAGGIAILAMEARRAVADRQTCRN